jgi:Tfp pilus assembly protein FimT
MIVIVLVGIVAAIAVPNFTQFINKSRTQAFHNELVAFLQYTRSAAVEQRTFVKACLGTAAWTVKKACTNGSETLRRLDIPPTLTVASTSTEITFRYNGTATDAQLITCQNGDFANGFTLDVSASGSIKSWPRGQKVAGTRMTACQQ